jgi:hypothetical protein
VLGDETANFQCRREDVKAGRQLIFTLLWQRGVGEDPVNKRVVGAPRSPLLSLLLEFKNSRRFILKIEEVKKA